MRISHMKCPIVCQKPCPSSTKLQNPQNTWCDSTSCEISKEARLSPRFVQALNSGKQRKAAVLLGCADKLEMHDCK